MILKEAKGVPAWRTPRIVPLVVLTGLAEGAALLSLALSAPVLLSILVALRATAWFAYTWRLAAPEPMGFALKRGLTTIRPGWAEGSTRT